MKRRMRNLIYLLLCCVLGISLIYFYAYDSSGEDRGNTGVQLYENVDGTEVEVIIEFLSYDETIKLIMEKKNITEAEAEVILGPKTSMTNTHSTSYAIRTERHKIYTYVVEIGAVWEVYHSGDLKQFNSYKTTWSGGVGSESYTWNEFYAIDKTPSYPCVTAIAEARGAIEVALDISYAGTVGVQLENSGFENTGAIGQTYIYRYPKTLSFVWELYPES